MKKRVLAALAMMVFIPRAAGAEPTPQDRALATQLFREAHALMAAGDYVTACPKLVESHRLDPGGGTILNAGLCHELAGLTATAWTELTEALGWARRDRRADREQTASEHLASLEPKLSRMSIRVPPAADVPGLAIVRDGSTINRAAWGSAVPIDPGRHHLEASATGRVPWSTDVDVGADGDQKIVVIPVLDLLPTPSPRPAPLPAPRAMTKEAPPPPPARDEGANAKRIVSIVTLGLGIVALGAGTYFGLRAFAKRSASDDACKPICRGDAVALNEDAKTSADIANVGFGTALVALGVGSFLFVTSARASGPARGAFVSVEHVF